MRKAFIEKLTELAFDDEKIALVVGDLGFGVVEPFRNSHPDRFFNVGVAEQNMIGVAAGMASEGRHVFVYSIGNFASFRCLEQIRNDVDYHRLSVTIVSVGGGVSYGNLGYSHHAVQDYALVRTLPNTIICAPGDPGEVARCVTFLAHNPQPSYLRLAKSGEPLLYENSNEPTPGEWCPIIENPDPEFIYLTTGNTLELTRRALINSDSLGRSALYSVPIWGQSTSQRHCENLQGKKNVITVEDHFSAGGFGSWTLECVNHIQFGRPNVFTRSLHTNVSRDVGSQDYLWSKYGLEEKQICV